MNEEFKKIREFIKDAQYRSALNSLEQLAMKMNEKQISDEIVLLTSNFNTIEKNERLRIREDNGDKNRLISGMLQLLGKLNDKKLSELSNEKLISKSDFSLKEQILNSRQFDVLGYSCIGVFDKYIHQIREAIIFGADVRVMYIKPESTAYELMLEHTKIASMEGDIVKIQKRINLLHEYLIKEKEIVQGSLTVRQITWIPSTNIFMFNRDYNHGLVSIKVNPVFYTSPMTERLNPQIFSKQKELNEFNYYHLQYEHLWKYHDSTVNGFKDELEYIGKRILKENESWR